MTGKGPGRKPHSANEATRASVETMSACGVPQDDICAVLGLTGKTLRKHYAPELANARIKANAVIAATLFQKAKAGDNACIFFWLKTRAGYRETNNLEVTGQGGGPVATVALSEEKYELIARRLLTEV